MSYRKAFVLGSAAAVLLVLATLTLSRDVPRSDALFHASVIDEVMTSYGGDANVQFVEINMLAASQNLVTNSVLGAFDASGSYLGDVLVVPADVPNSGAGVRWTMGTSAFQTASGLTPDFIIPASLPTGGGMVCWGAPGVLPPAPGSWDHTVPNNYVDCLSYGTYSGPGNFHIGTVVGQFPAPDDADGHSLDRTMDTNQNANDFVCADPAGPENNNGAFASMAATTPCGGAVDTDGDGLSDDDETNIHGTDPNDSDSDDDSLNDGDEVNIEATDPLDPDTDDDKLCDAARVDNDANGIDPADVCTSDEVNVHGTDPLLPDTDTDNFDDGKEVFMGTNPLDDCANTDTAGDELVDPEPEDFDDNQIVNILDIVQLTPPVFGSVGDPNGDGDFSDSDPNYAKRKDLNADKVINILDIVLLTPPVFGSSCV